MQTHIHAVDIEHKFILSVQTAIEDGQNGEPFGALNKRTCWAGGGKNIGGEDEDEALEGRLAPERPLEEESPSLSMAEFIPFGGRGEIKGDGQEVVVLKLAKRSPDIVEEGGWLKLERPPKAAADCSALALSSHEKRLISSIYNQ